MLLLNIYPVQLNYSPLHQETGFYIKSAFEYGFKNTSQGSFDPQCVFCYFQEVQHFHAVCSADSSPSQPSKPHPLSLSTARAPLKVRSHSIPLKLPEKCVVSSAHGEHNPVSHTSGHSSPLEDRQQHSGTDVPMACTSPGWHLNGVRSPVGNQPPGQAGPLPRAEYRWL